MRTKIYYREGHGDIDMDGIAGSLPRIPRFRNCGEPQSGTKDIHSFRPQKKLCFSRDPYGRSVLANQLRTKASIWAFEACLGDTVHT
jgi:hypothetical protein